MLEDNTLGGNLKKYRKENKLTQLEAADMLNISLTYYGTIERGKKQPSRDLLLKISNKFNISLDALMKDSTVHLTMGYMDRIQDLPKNKQEFAYDIINLIDNIVKRVLDFVAETTT